MTTKLLIISLCILAGAMTGIVVNKNLTKRAGYYSALVKLINTLISEVRFRKNTVNAVLKEFSVQNPSPLDTHIKAYIAAGDKSAVDIAGTVLKKNESDDVKKFLLSLGSTDAETQLIELENFKRKFTEVSAVAEDKRKKFGPMFIKLGILAGLLLGILLI